MKKTFFVAVGLAVVMVVTAGLRIPDAKAQSGTRRYAPRSTSQQPSPSFEKKFWDFLQNARYKNWAPWPGQNGDFYKGESPHGAFLKMYIDRTAASDPKNLPHGSIIIKENYGPDKKTLMAITIMYRSKGYDSEHRDWYWVKYDPNGNVAMKGNMRLAGKVAGCIECHSGAHGDDFLFANDE